jgi:NAD(P)-dependent dehydrogenase (short-subunit alcohol dehydrogenase family)
MQLDLTDKRILISGAHRGTGQIIAARFAEEGAQVLLHGFTEDQAAAACLEIDAQPVHGDILTDAGADSLVEQCLTGGRVVDVLVNNYGTADAGTWATSDAGAWIDAYQKNVLSAQRLIQRLTPGMRARGWGRIINLGTVGSTRPSARMPHYYAAKGALATMTVSLAKELGGTGITVNLVSPGLIRTPEVEAAYLESGRRKGWGQTWEEIEPRVAADIPIGRIVRREEVADLVLFLASPLSDAIHGQNIRIDGGSLDVVN